jgi:hypothetical protein
MTHHGRLQRNPSRFAHRGTVPVADVDGPIDLSEVIVYVGPRFS